MYKTPVVEANYGKVETYLYQSEAYVPKLTFLGITSVLRNSPDSCEIKHDTISMPIWHCITSHSPFVIDDESRRLNAHVDGVRLVLVPAYLAR